MKVRTLGAGLLLVSLCTAALGGTVVVPNTQATTAGDMPIKLSGNAARTQEVVGGGQFGGTAITIVALRLRSSPGTGPINFSGASLQVTLSTTNAFSNTKSGHSLPSTTYASNVGPDATVTYNGAFVASSPGCAAPGPCPFDIVIPFSTPFSYDPNNGRLLIDLTASALTGGFTGSFDGVSFPDASNSNVAVVSGDPALPSGSLSIGGFVFGLETGTPCTTSDPTYPCSIAGSLLVTSPPTGNLFTGTGGTGGNGVAFSFINDPQNPGYSLIPNAPLQGNGPAQFTFEGTFNLATLTGQPTISGGKISITCGVTGTATVSFTASTPGGPVVLNCPKLSSPSASSLVAGQVNFSPVNSLSVTLKISASAPGTGDNLILAGYSFQVHIGSPIQAPTITGVLNAGDFSPRLSPGMLAQVLGTNLWAGAAGQCPANGCSGLAVSVGSKQAYAIYASSTLLQLQIPYEASVGPSNITVTLDGAASAAFPITLAAVAPAFLTQNSSGVGPASITTQTGVPVTFGAPGKPGDTLQGIATGLGVTNPPTPTGPPAAGNPAAVTPDLTIGGVSAKVLYAGTVKGGVGYDQVNLTVPAGVQGTQSIVLTSGAASSSAAVTIPIAGISRLVNNGGFGSAGLAAPGEIATVFANGLGATDQLSGFPATKFQGAQVTFNSTAAPLFHLVASTGQQKPPLEQQIDLLVPQELPTSGKVDVQLTTSSAFYPNYNLTMAPAVPGLFRIQDPANTKRFNIIATFPNSAWLALPVSTTSALKLPACGSNISLASFCGQPATIGDTLIIWMTGLGITTPNGDPNGKPLATGQVPPLDGSVLYETPTLPAVTIGGVTAKVLYSVLAPGYPGDYQVALEVPSGVTSGDDIPVVVTMFGNSDTATLSIQPRP